MCFRAEKETWIREKYVEKRFVQKRSSGGHRKCKTQSPDSSCVEKISEGRVLVSEIYLSYRERLCGTMDSELDF